MASGERAEHLSVTVIALHLLTLSRNWWNVFLVTTPINFSNGFRLKNTSRLFIDSANDNINQFRVDSTNHSALSGKNGVCMCKITMNKWNDPL